MKERAKAIIPIEFETTQNIAGSGSTRSSSGTPEEDGRPLPTEDDDDEEENSIAYHPIDMLLDFGIAANDIEKLKVGGYHTVESVRNQFMQRRNRTFRRQSINNFNLYIVGVSFQYIIQLLTMLLFSYITTIIICTALKCTCTRRLLTPRSVNCRISTGFPKQRLLS